LKLIPYHEIGVAKYQGLGMEYRLKNVRPMENQQIQEIEEKYRQYHIPVHMNISGRIT
jgi:pyruvate formate lyase activating enzyme